MDTGTDTHCSPRFRLLEPRRILRLRHAALRVLETVGVRVLHQGAVDLLAGSGAGVLGGTTAFHHGSG